ncbi:MAG TPA: hemolysin family protein [Chloroflexota bacterium]
MTLPSELYLAAAVFVGLALFLFSATAETALAALSRARTNQLAERGLADARRLDVFLDYPNRFLTSTNVLRLLAGVLTTTFLVALEIRAWGATPGQMLVTSLAIFLVLTLLLSFPRGIAVHDPERTLIALYYPVRATAALLSPVVRLLNRIGGAAARAAGLGDVPEGPVHTEDDLHTHASAAHEVGIIQEDEQEMIDAVIDMDKTTAREIMVPRMDVTGLPADATVDRAVDLIRARGYSRIPVYEESIDNIIGVLYAKDLFRYLRAVQTDLQVRGLVRPAYFIPESKKTDELLRELQRQKVHIAIVADEYGGTAGIVTIEDLLEEIVGDIQDEYDREEAKIVPISEDEAIFDATVSIDDVNDALKLNLEGEDVDTIGGLLYERLGKVPALGDQTELEGVLLRVESTAGRRIRKVRVTRRPVETAISGAA